MPDLDPPTPLYPALIDLDIVCRAAGCDVGIDGDGRYWVRGDGDDAACLEMAPLAEVLEHCLDEAECCIECGGDDLTWGKRPDDVWSVACLACEHREPWLLACETEDVLAVALKIQNGSITYDETEEAIRGQLLRSRWAEVIGTSGVVRLTGTGDAAVRAWGLANA